MVSRFAKPEKLMQVLEIIGIKETSVLKAMASVPREKFVAAGMEHRAWEDQALPIGFGQTISHPSSVAVMTEALQITPGKRILEIGTGSGYQAAVLCALGAQVFTIERIPELGRRAQKVLNSLRYHCVTRIGDGTRGWPEQAPFDGIIVTAGAPVLVDHLCTQLTDSGRLIIPIGGKDEQLLTLFTRQGDSFEKKELRKIKFVPLIGKNGWSLNND